MKVSKKNIDIKLLFFISWLPIVLTTSTSTTNTGTKSPNSDNATSQPAIKNTAITSQINLVSGYTTSTYNGSQTARSDIEIPTYNTTINHSHVTTTSSMNNSQLTPSYHIQVNFTSIYTNHATDVSHGTNATTETVSLALSSIITGESTSEYTAKYSSNPGEKSSTIAKTSSNETTSLNSALLISATSATEETISFTVSSVSPGISTSEKETNYSISPDLKSSLINSANLSTKIIKSINASEIAIKTTLISKTNTKSSSFITSSVVTMVSESEKVPSNITETSSIKTTSSTGDAGWKSTYIMSSSSIKSLHWKSTYGILSNSSYSTALKLNTSTWIQSVSLTKSQVSIYNEYTSYISRTTMTSSSIEKTTAASENSVERSVRSSKDPLIASKLYSSTEIRLTINATIAIGNIITSTKNILSMSLYTQNISISKALSNVTKSSCTTGIPTSIKNSSEVLQTSSNGGVDISQTTASAQRETTGKPSKRNTSTRKTLKNTRSEITNTASTIEVTPTRSSSIPWPPRTSKDKFQNLSTVSPSSIIHSAKAPRNVTKSSSTTGIPTSIKNSSEVLQTSSNGGVDISQTTASTQRETTAKPSKIYTSTRTTLKNTRSEITNTASTIEITPTRSSSISWPSRTSKFEFQNLSTVSPSSITHSAKESYSPKSSSTANIPTSIKNSREVLGTSPNGGEDIQPTIASTQRETAAKPFLKNTSTTETLKKSRSEITNTASATAETLTQSSSILWPQSTSKVKFPNLSTVSPSSITHSAKVEKCQCSEKAEWKYPDNCGKRCCTGYMINKTRSCENYASLSPSNPGCEAVTNVISLKCSDQDAQDNCPCKGFKSSPTYYLMLISLTFVFLWHWTITN